MEKRMIVYVWNTMHVGGIETYIYNEMKYLKQQGHVIAQVMGKEKEIDKAFEGFFDEENVLIFEKIDASILEEQCRNNNVNRLQIIVFDFIPVAEAEIVKKQIKVCDVDVFWYIPHFTGDTIYLEDAFEGKRREKVRKRLCNIISKLNSNDSIRYFATVHIDTFERRYGIKVEDRYNMIVPKCGEVKDIYDQENRIKVYERDEFRIVAASRLEFPHKGFILGLIDIYAEMKIRYPNITLEIIGDGDGINEVNKKISKLAPSIKKDIVLTGALSLDDLKMHYDKANLSISVAGCFTTGAKRGVLSLPARHYSYDCEVYGFLPESWEKRLSSEPGEEVMPYIERALNMEKQEYLDLCKAGYECSINEKIFTAAPLYETLKNSNPECPLSSDDIKYILNLRKKRHKSLQIMRRRELIRKEGLLKPVFRKIKRLIYER